MARTSPERGSPRGFSPRGRRTLKDMKVHLEKMETYACIDAHNIAINDTETLILALELACNEIANTEAAAHITVDYYIAQACAELRSVQGDTQ